MLNSVHVRQELDENRDTTDPFPVCEINLTGHQGAKVVIAVRV